MSGVMPLSGGRPVALAWPLLHLDKHKAEYGDQEGNERIYINREQWELLGRPVTLLLQLMDADPKAKL